LVSVPVLSEAMTLAELDSGQASDDSVSPRHPLDANRQHRSDNRWQPFRHCRHGQRHADNEHVEYGGQAPDLLDNNDRRDHHDGYGDDDYPQEFASPIELSLKRCCLVPCLLE
jgi:hypothetical protein